MEVYVEMNIEDVKYFAPYVVSIIAILGWIVSYKIAKKQELVKRKLDVRIEPLISAYKAIEDSILSPDNSYQTEFSSAVSDIYLFGSGKQIRKLNQLISELDDNCNKSKLTLLGQLRREIRKELGMKFKNDAHEVDLIAYSVANR